MKLPDYYVFDPTGNITVLIDGERDKSTADEIMERVPAAEQTGFVTDGGLTLTMAGGEFCGNASMCAAALYFLKNDVTDVTLKVSGADSPVRVTTETTENGTLRCTVEMPKCTGVTEEKLEADGKEYVFPCARMQGIYHLISEGLLDEKNAEKNIRKWCADLGADALGIMLYDDAKKELKPLVFVPGADTLFWESSCASGSCAVGAYLAKKSGEKVSVELSEPAGKLFVTASPDGVTTLTGNVKLL